MTLRRGEESCSPIETNYSLAKFYLRTKLDEMMQDPPRRGL